MATDVTHTSKVAVGGSNTNSNTILHTSSSSSSSSIDNSTEAGDKQAAAEIPQPFAEQQDSELPDYGLEVCTASYKASYISDVQAGQDPSALFKWGCSGIPGCAPASVSRMIASLRKRGKDDILSWVPCDLFRIIRGRSLWLMGDSQTHGFYKAMVCVMSTFNEPNMTADVPVTTAPDHVQRIKDTVIKDPAGGKGIPFCRHLVQGTRICHVHVNKGFHMRDDYLPNLELLTVQKSDFVISNFGQWHHMQTDPYSKLVQDFVKYWQNHREELPLMAWRDNSAAHYTTVNGDLPHPKDMKQFMPAGQGCVAAEGVTIGPGSLLQGENIYVMSGTPAFALMRCCWCVHAVARHPGT